MNILRGSVIGLAGVLGGGVLAWPAVTNADTPDQDFLYKRDERSVDLVLADDEDDDPTNDRARDRFTRGDVTNGTRGDVTNNDVTNNVTNNATRGDNTNGTRGDATDDGTRNDVTNGDVTNDATNDSSRDATS